MTTPVPTTAAAHLAMVEALRDVQRSGVAHNDDLKACKHCNRFQDGKDYPPGHGKDGVAAPDWYDHDWYKKLGVLPPACVIATRALEDWEKREPLRDSERLRELAAHLSNAREPGFATNSEMIGVFWDCVDSVLFGTAWPGTEPPSGRDMAEARRRADRLFGTGPRTGGEQGEGGE